MTCKRCNDTGLQPRGPYGQLYCDCYAGLTKDTELDCEALGKSAYELGREFGRAHARAFLKGIKEAQRG